MRTGRWAALAVAAALASGAGWLWWHAARDPEVPWLARRSPAEWILYPAAPSGSAHAAIELDAIFRRSFALRERPRTARLELRCFRRCRGTVNGTPLALTATVRDGAAPNWKEPEAGDLSSLLRPGANSIAVTVANDLGPPALWLALAADSRLLASDRSWEASLAGATWRPARLAVTPMSDWGELRRVPARQHEPAPAELRRVPARQHEPAAALAAHVPLLLAFAGLSAAALWIVAFAARRSPQGRSRFVVPGLLVIAALLWAALFWHNRGLDPGWGFDADSHLDYVRAVLERGRLPLADEGWEAYQPPLYYLAAAALLRLAGHARVDASAVLLLRALGWAAFVVQSACLLGSLRLLFPAAPRRWLTGLALGIFLPAQIYLLQYVTNEGWAAALSSAAVFLCLLCLRKLAGADPPSPLPFLLLGAVLGLAMLTKFSALVTVAAVIAALTGRLAASGARPPRVYLRTLGATLAAGLLVCGWHYARVAAHFGRPLVGNWDRASGLAWWQEPGYHTAFDLVRFGRSLGAPLLAAFHSIPDALYSTLWGDGMLGGSGLLAAHPPWNYGLMAAGYLLALLPSAAIVAGAGAVLFRFARQPRAEDALLLGLLGGTGLAILAMSLRIASYAQPKAFYGLAALVSLCAFGARGLDLFAGAAPHSRRRAGRATAHLRSALVWMLLGVWACTAYATFWMVRADPGPRAAAAAALDPAGWLARAPALPPAEAAVQLERATAASPDHPFAWLLLGDALARGGKPVEAMAAWREALRVDAHSAAAHLHLGRVLALSGRAEEALYHLRLAERLGSGENPERDGRGRRPFGESVNR